MVGDRRSSFLCSSRGKIHNSLLLATERANTAHSGVSYTIHPPPPRPLGLSASGSNQPAPLELHACPPPATNPRLNP